MTIVEKAKEIIALHIKAREVLKDDRWKEASLLLVEAINLSADILLEQRRLFRKVMYEPSLN